MNFWPEQSQPRGHNPRPYGASPIAAAPWVKPLPLGSGSTHLLPPGHSGWATFSVGRRSWTWSGGQGDRAVQKAARGAGN
jgi:hypothetical protein